MIAAGTALARRVLPHSLKVAVVEVLCAPIVGRAIGFALRDRIPCRGIRVHTSFEFVASRTKAEVFWGIYESAETRFVQRYLRSDVDVIELGSSLGVVSCHIRRILLPRARLVCVEANPALLPAWRANMDANGRGLPAKILNFAIDYDDHRDSVALEIGTDTAATRIADDAATATSRITVPTARLCDLLERERFEGYALVADIEGAEAGILFEDGVALANCRQVLIELHDTTHRGRDLSWQDLLSALEEIHGFGLVDRHGPVCVLER